MEATKGKKSQIIWTKGLNKKFEEAVKKLGIDNAAPMKILELMKVDGLTRDQVSSHLQKYRILLKKIANDNSGVYIASNPSLFESSMANDASWNNYSKMLNQEQMNMPNYSGMRSTNYSPYLNTSSSSLPLFEGSCSLPTEGYFMQEMENNLDDQQRNLIYDTPGMGVVNSMNFSNSGFVPCQDNILNVCGGFSTQVLPYNNIDMSPSNYIGNMSNTSFGENSNGFESNYSSQSEFVEIGSLYGSNSNGNLENAIVEDDLLMTDVDIACLISFADDYHVYGRTSNNIPVTLDSPIQAVNSQKYQDTVSFDSNENEETPSINQTQILDAYLLDFDPTSNQQLNEQFMDPLLSSQPLASDMTFKAYF